MTTQTCLPGGMHIIYNKYCLSFDRSKFRVTTGFWLIIMSSDIVIAPRPGLHNGKWSVFTVLETLKTTDKSFKRAEFSPSWLCVVCRMHMSMANLGARE